ncbi:hypothetical protein OVA24_12155 [Luteolibacter sp. SL250]|uniref:hypothetical protein n=1 Tax=Luteolibacter sp. SL250 TaxID=2995170 RepID=UPI00226FC198|nr:hypothetical protein [Luteolibacter sp. SL250]WAC17991.1 hypothetical protein OVA24_12155 [Luteolibacter sp. SL250]
MKKFRLIAASLGCLFSLIPQAGAASGKLVELRKERTEINRAIRKAIPDATKIDPELAKLQRASIDASKAHLQAMEGHPALKEVNAELEKENNALIQAITAKDDAAKQAVQTKLQELQHRRSDEAAKIPELAKLAEESNQAGSAYFTREKEILASHPETKDLAARLAKINDEIQAEMKK